MFTSEAEIAIAFANAVIPFIVNFSSYLSPIMSRSILLIHVEIETNPSSPISLWSKFNRFN